MIFTRVKEEEAAEVLRLYRSLVGTEYCVWDENYPAMHEIRFDLSRNALFCMKEKEQIIGVISIDDDPQVQALKCWSESRKPAAELSRVGVALERQNEGIAGKLLRNAMDELKRQGYRGVRLLVAKLNVKAVRAYQKLDFHVAGECVMFGHEYWCYEKELS